MPTADVSCATASPPTALTGTTIKSFEITGPCSRVGLLLLSGTSGAVSFTAARGALPADPAVAADEGYVAAVVGSYDELAVAAPAFADPTDNEHVFVKVKGNGNTVRVVAIP